MKINFEDYLSESEIKEICADVIRERLTDYLSKSDSFERLIGNVSYKMVAGMVDDTFIENGGLKEVLKEKVLEVINELTSFTVFKSKKDYFNDTNSVGQDLLEEIVIESRPLIKEKVEQLIETHDYFIPTYDEIDTLLYEALYEYMFNKKKEYEV